MFFFVLCWKLFVLWQERSHFDYFEFVIEDVELVLQWECQKRLQGEPQIMNDVLPIIDGHRCWVIIDVAIGNIEDDMLGRVLRQQG